MMTRRALLLILLLTAAIAPYFMLCFCALPYADDFCYAWAYREGISFATRFIREYMHWSGRYSAHLLLLYSPLQSGRLLCYQGTLIVFMIALLGSLSLFVRQLVPELRWAMIITLLLLLFDFSYMPHLTEGIYWYTSSSYLWGDIALVLHLSALIAALRRTGSRAVVLFCSSAMLLILAIGFTEVAAAVIPAYYLLASFAVRGYSDRTARDRRLYRTVIVFFVIAFISSAFVIFAPGNFKRSHQFAGRFDMWHSLWYASLQTGRFIMKWLANIPALALSMVIVAMAGKLPDGRIVRIDHRLIGMVIIFTVFMSAFIPYFSTGILGQYRTINYAFFYFILLWPWWLVSVSRQHSLYNVPAVRWAGSRSFTMIILSVAIMTCTANGGRILRDTWQGTFATYRDEFMHRQEGLIAHPDMAVAPLRTVPETFQIVDARADTTWWVNKCIKISKVALR